MQRHVLQQRNFGNAISVISGCSTCAEELAFNPAKTHLSLWSGALFALLHAGRFLRNSFLFSNDPLREFGSDHSAIE